MRGPDYKECECGHMNISHGRYNNEKCCVITGLDEAGEQIVCPCKEFKEKEPRLKA